uniref:Wall-associated receptor kinase C-terminal domain-containing protein n=1 Tax=Phaseolus vulgaris TaxID=3885 RepID=V7CQP9_PHAVU|nr:hypothetical protein PHAVU_002G257200g [Phaseolus vulgaris]ESW31663.1 hypothetical protein PHAVU_002G257200g [Phaseolus vulgaris]
MPRHLRLNSGEVPLRHGPRLRLPSLQPLHNLRLQRHRRPTLPQNPHRRHLPHHLHLLRHLHPHPRPALHVHLRRHAPLPTSFTLDWTSPFHLASSTFLLLSCHPSLSLSSPLCDPSFDYLCASIYTCPAVASLGLPLFPPTNSCCVYAPANLDDNGQLDLKAMQCGAYASVVSLGDTPTDPSRWVYGVALKFSYGGALDNNYVTTKCSGCESSGGVCGFSEPGNGFLCVCKGGYNTTFDCSPAYNNQNQDYLLDSASAFPFLSASYVWSSILGGIVFSLL